MKTIPHQTKPNRNFSFNVKVAPVKALRCSYELNVDVATKDTINQNLPSCIAVSATIAILVPNPASTRQTQYLSLAPSMASDYDLVLANFKMKLKVECCPKSIRIRFHLDKLKEPEIESGVPDSDWWKVCSPQSD